MGMRVNEKMSWLDQIMHRVSRPRDWHKRAIQVCLWLISLSLQSAFQLCNMEIWSCLGSRESLRSQLCLHLDFDTTLLLLLEHIKQRDSSQSIYFKSGRMSTNQDSSSTSKERESGDLTTSSSTEQQQHRMPSSSLPNQAIHPESQSKSNQPSSKPTSARKSLSQSSTSANPNSSRISSTSTSNKNAERQSLISAIQQIQSENAKLEMELQSERNRLRLDQSNKRRKLDSQLEDSDWQNQIKVAMQGLEDDQLWV